MNYGEKSAKRQNRLRQICYAGKASLSDYLRHSFFASSWLQSPVLPVADYL